MKSAFGLGTCSSHGRTVLQHSRLSKQVQVQLLGYQLLLTRFEAVARGQHRLFVQKHDVDKPACSWLFSGRQTLAGLNSIDEEIHVQNNR